MKSFSSQHILSVPTITPAAKEIDYYVGLFEFPQGSSPKILWDNKGKSVQNREAFLLYVVNIPTDLRISVYNPKPTIIKSEYMSTNFIAIYVQIADVEARGFSRPTVLVLGHQQSKMINYIYSNLLEKFKYFAYEMQSNAGSIFPEEVSIYAASLHHTISKYPESGRLLESKVGELESMLKKAGVEMAPDSKALDEKPEFFTRINNELRPIITLTHFDEMKEELTEFVSSLPNDIVLCNSEWKAQGWMLNVVNAVREEGSAEFMTLVKNKKIYDCLFSLQSGHTLYIISSKPGLANAVGARISSLSPFESVIPVCNIGEEKEHPSIVLAASFEQNTNSDVSCLDLDNDKYTGVTCPLDSILYKELTKAENRSAALQVMLFSNDLKRIGSRFIRKVVEMSARAPQTRERMDAQMRVIGFSESDFPLITNWARIARNMEIDSSSVNCYLNN